MIHLLLTAGLRWVPAISPDREQSQTEIELLPLQERPPARETQKIVRQALVPDKMKRADDEAMAEFLSAERVRVQKQMQAANPGMTANQALQKTKPKGQKPAEKPSEDGDIFKDRPAQENPFASQNNPNPSTVGENLPNEISVGSMTALNTDKFTYYTFYARVEELVRFRWETKVRQSLGTIDRDTFESKIKNKKFVTYFEFWLEPNGKLHSVHLMKESGNKKFDMAAEYSFRDAQFFPNPPKDLVEDDGFIRLKYTFTVRL